MVLSTDNLQIEEWIKDLLNAKFITSKGCNQKTDRPNFCISCGGSTLTNYEVKESHKGHTIIQGTKCSWCYAYRESDLKDFLDLRYVTDFSVNSNKIYFPKSRIKENKHRPMNGLSNICCVSCGYEYNNKEGNLFCSILCKLVFPPDKIASAVESFNARKMAANKSQEKNKKGHPKVGKEKNKKQKKRTNDEVLMVQLKLKKPKTLRNNNSSKKVENNEGNLEFFATVTLNTNNGKKISNEEGNLNLLTKKSLKNIEVPCDSSLRKRPRKGVPHRAPLF